MPLHNERLTGKITRVNHKDGWGFILSPEKKHIRYYFKWTNLLHTTKLFEDIKAGMMVEFTPLETPESGWHAIKIKVLD